MAKTDYDQQIEKEAEDHITLGMLLRKERSPDDRQAVEKIIHSELSVSQKILRIERVDAKANRTSKPDETNPPIGSGRRRSPLKFELSKIKAIIKKPQSQSALFRYLFHEYPLMREFGRKTHTLHSVFLLPSLKVEERVPAFLTENLQSWATDLVKILNFVLQVGWSHLRKWEYNLLVLLRKLCHEIVSTNFRILNFKDRTVINRLRTVETLFYIMNYRPNYPDMALTAILRVLEKHPDRAEDAEQASVLVRRILYKDFTLPSLHNVLVALNMLKIKRYLSIGDLISTELGDIITTTHFACDKPVQAKIDSYVFDMKRRLTALQEQRNEVRRMRNYISMDEDGTIDYKPLRDFYEGGTKKGESASFAEDREDMMAFAPRFLRVFDDTFYRLLSDTVSLPTVTRARIFDPSFFELEFPKFRQYRSRLEKISFTFRKFPTRRFVDIKKTGKGAIAVEAEILQLVNDSVYLLRNIGRRLERVLAAPRPADEEKQSRSPIMQTFLQGRGLSVPFEDETIRAPSALAGRTVGEALAYATSVCFLATVFFYDQNTIDLLQRDQMISDKVQQQLQVLKRIADPESYQEIETMFA